MTRQGRGCRDAGWFAGIVSHLENMVLKKKNSARKQHFLLVKIGNYLTDKCKYNKNFV